MSKKTATIFFAGLILLLAIVGLAIIAEPANTAKLYDLAEFEECDQGLLSTRHKVIVSSDNALRLGNNKLGELGSQSKVDETRWQVIGGQLNYLLPLAYGGSIKAWTLRAAGTQGYLMLSAENQAPDVRYVKGYNLRYIPSGVFGYNLKRHIYANYPAFWQGDSIFQLDGNGQPVYVTVLDLPTVWGVTGDKPAGVVVTDPETGKMARYDASHIPDWIQRSYDSQTIIQYLGWWGSYPHGYWSSVFSGKNVTAPVPDLAYRTNDDTGEIRIVAASASSVQPLCGDNGRLYYAAAMDNPNDASHSLTGYVVANASNLPIKLMFYRINESIDNLGAAQNIQQTDAVSHVSGHRIKALSLYNISGQYAWLGPVATSYDEFAAIGLARLKDGKPFVGNNLADAYAQAGLAPAI